MGILRALIIGVSKYTLIKADELPFCKNDIYAMQQAFIQGLRVDPANIILCGTTGIVTVTEVASALQHLSDITEEDDSLLLYFSGHGANVGTDHCLVLSDRTIKTQEIIKFLETNKSKNKILFLDCCLAGNFTVDGTAMFSVDETADRFAGKGYAVIASCNAQQYSYGHPEKPISLFTSFLYYALTHKLIIKEGKKSLYDIQKLLAMLLDSWNRKNPGMTQTPIYRAKIGGTVYFDVEDYHPYGTETFFEDCETYIIYSVKDVHSSIAKRYCVQVILKQPMSFVEIAAINHKIVEKVKDLHIYSNSKQEEKWKHHTANIVFCYFGLDESDMINLNYLCHTTWVDDTQDKNWWYKMGNNYEVIDDIHFSFHPYYQSLKTFTEEHMGTKEQLISETRKIITQMVSLAEKLIALYNEYKNGTISEDVFRIKSKGISAEINKLYFEQTNLNIPPDDLNKWSQCCTNLAATIDDLTLYYGQNKFEERTPENRKDCMEISINRYYSDLEKLKEIDTTI